MSHEGRDVAASVATPPDATGLDAAAAALRAGRLVAFPTETVYGLGADALDPEAVRRIFAAKGRPADHPVIVHVAGPEALDGLVAPLSPDLGDDVAALTAAFWPGPLTLVLPRGSAVPDVVTGGQDTVGVRCPDHPVAQALLEAFGGPIAAPSANPFGHISPTEPEHVIADLGDRVAVVLDRTPSEAEARDDADARRVGIESTILSLGADGPTLLRPGAILRDELAHVLGRPVRDPREASPRASGRLPRHYAPRTPAAYVPETDLAARLDAEPDAAVLARHAAPPGHRGPYRRLPSDPAAAGRMLYAALRDLDAAGAPSVLIEAVPLGAAWEAVRDRLRKATAPEPPDPTSTPDAEGTSR